MSRARPNPLHVFALVAVISVGIVLPARAEYDKAYRFKLPDGWTEEWVKAVRIMTVGMEIATDQYVGWRIPFASPGTVSYVLSGGVYDTRIAYNEKLPYLKPNPSPPPDYWSWDKALKIGWRTSDHGCRLRDLKWVKTAAVGGGTEPIIPVELGVVPGGGELLWSPDGWPDKWVWRIHHDIEPEPGQEPSMPLHGLELGVFGAPLDQGELAEITEEGAGIFDKKAANIDGMTADLRDPVQNTPLPPGWVTSLIAKLDAAAADKAAGDVAYGPPNFDIDGALLLWGQAAQHMRTVAAQIRNDGEALGRKWEVPQEWAGTADAIADALLLLPGAAPPQVVSQSLAGGELQAASVYPAGDGTAAIPPGGSVDIVLADVAPGDAVVLHGDVADGAGNIVAEWVEQVVIPHDRTPPTLTISPTPDFDPGTGEGYLSLCSPATVSIASGDGDVAFTHWGISEPGSDLTLEGDPQPVTLRFGDVGTYKTVCLARDESGNLSDPTIVNVTVSPADLGSWISESYVTDPTDPEAGYWIVAADGFSVTEARNSLPTFLCSDFPALNTVVEANLGVGLSTSDDDYIGFVLGFEPGDTTNPDADYLLVDWKRADQWWNFGPPCGFQSLALKGLAVSRVFGAPTVDELWSHCNADVPCSDLNSGVVELGRGITLGNTGWQLGQTYAFRFEFTPTSLRVYVDGVLELDIGGSFSDGNFGLYDFSQPATTYGDVVVGPLGGG